MPTPEQSFNAYQGATRKAEKRATARAKGQKPHKGEGGHDWGDGKGNVHSIPLARHKKNVKTKRAARLNDPAKFVAPRGATDVNRDATASANLRYGGVERNQALQERQRPVYYQNYLDQVGGIKTAVDTGYQKAIDDVTARQQATATSDTTARTALGAQMTADAKSRGATVDPSLLANDVNAANVRNTNQSAFANLLGAQQQANNTYFGGQQQVGAAASLAEQGRIATDVKGTAADKGAYKSQYVTDARADERTNLLQRAAFEIPSANTALTQKTSTANSKRTQRTAAAKRKADAKTKGQTVNKYGYTNEQWARFSPSHRQRVQKSLGPSGTGPAKPKAGAKPGSKPLSASGRDTTVTIRKAIPQVRQHDDGTPGYWKGAYDELVDKNGIDPVVARAIIQGARHARLGPKTKKGLKDTYGIEGLTFSKRKKGRAKPGGTQWPTSKRPPSKPKAVLNPFD